MSAVTSISRRFEWRLYRPRLRSTALWMGLALLAALPLLYLHFNTTPFVFDTTVGEATIHFESSQPRVLFPGQCTRLSWNLEHIKAVYINDKGHIGQDSKISCNTDRLPTMRVNFLDETERQFRMPIEKLYANPLVIGLWIIVVAGLVGAAYGLFEIPGALFMLTVILFWAVTRISIETGSDYVIHLRYQQIVLDTGNLTALPPHPLYYGLGVVTKLLFPGISLESANFVVILLAYGFGSVALYGLLKSIVGESSGSKARQALIYIPLTLSLWSVVPLVVSGNPLNTLIGRPDIPINMFNSPTLTLLKPFAVLIFLGLAKWLTDTPYHRWLAVLGVALVTAAATLTKPNYTMALLPAVGLVLAYQFIKPFRLNRTLVIAGVIVPAVAVLGWQYLRVYAPGAATTLYTAKQSASIGLAPFELFVTYWNFSIPQLLSGLLLSLVFPLTVYLAYFQAARRSLILNLAWLTFFIGQSFAYLFIEIAYQAAGNMTWGGRITLFVLFATSLGFFLRQNAGVLFNSRQLSRDPRFYLCAVIYIMHIIPYLQYAQVKIP